MKKYIVIDSGAKILETSSYEKAQKKVDQRNKNKKHPRAYMDEKEKEQSKWK